MIDYEALRAARVARLRARSGWLSLVGKVFLDQGRTVLGPQLPAGAPPRVGEIEVAGNVVRLVVDDAVDARLEATGEAVKDRVLRSDRDGSADAILVAGFALELMERGDTLALRVRDLREIPRPFAGIDRFPIDPGWRVAARLVPHASPITVDLDFETGDSAAISSGFVSPGIVVFEHGGAEHRIQAVYEDASQKRLFLLFRDGTSGPESYGLGRFVYADLPDASGNLIVDFNLALLPGCAFTPYATCPIPPRENRVAPFVRAGEKNYLGELAV